MKKQIMRYRIILIAIIVAIAGIIYVRFCTDSDKVQYETAHSTKENEVVIYVYVSGAVKCPGVYALSDKSRVCDVLEMAGGVLDTAYIDNINMASPLLDGQRINIITVSEFESQKEEESYLVNINEAGKERLMTLPGIGDVRAEAIIKYRQENGRFETIEDIMKVNGIKKAAFDKIKDLITA